MRKLHWSLLKRVYRLLPRYAVYRRLGKRWLLDNRNWVDQQLIIRRPYEVAQLAYCLELLGKHQITHFFDIGANFGLYSVLLSDAPSLKVIDAFEPLPRNIDQLAANLYLNGLDTRVNANALALSDRDARMELYVDAQSTGVSTLDPGAVARQERAYGLSIEVQTRALDRLSDLSDTAILAKIDVEGSELQVLKGMTALLSANRAWLQIETMPETADQVTSFMHQQGYVFLQRIGADSYYAKGSA